MIRLYLLRADRALLSILCMLTMILFSSCSKEEIARGESVTEPKAKDSYTYIALRNDGRIFEIGDETGEVKEVGNIPEITFNIVYNTVTSSGSRTYLYEQMPEVISDDSAASGFKGQLCELDVKTLESKCSVLDFSDEVFPEFSGLIALDWDEGNKILVGLVTDVVNAPGNHPIYVIHIDPETLKISYTGIQLVQDYINSTCLVGNKYYIASRYDVNNREPVFRSLNLATGILNTMGISDVDSPPFLLSYNAEAQNLFGIARKRNTGSLDATYPITYDLVDQSIANLSPSTDVNFSQEFGKSFYNSKSKEHVALAGPHANLMRYNMDTETLKFMELSRNNNELSSLVAIINVK